METQHMAWQWDRDPDRLKLAPGRSQELFMLWCNIPGWAGKLNFSFLSCVTKMTQTRQVKDGRRLSFRWIKHNFFSPSGSDSFGKPHAVSSRAAQTMMWGSLKLFDFSGLMSFVTEINKCALGFYSIKFLIAVDLERFLFIKIKGIYANEILSRRLAARWEHCVG